MGEVLTAFGNAFAASAALALPAAFLWGVLSVVLSPCHLSSIPLVVAYMNGDQQFPAGRRALVISSSFAVGILASIVVIGVVTAAAGRMAGDVGRTGTYALAAVFFVVGLNLIGVLPLPTWSTPAAGTKRRGPWGALVLGLVFGAALGPCTFAFMAPLLGLAFRSGAEQAAYGALLVTVYGLGHGAAIVAAGVSAQSVQRWLAWKNSERAARLVRGAAGLAVIAGGAYFLYTAT
jgi:cytochrome c-type biogenesis protein